MTVAPLHSGDSKEQRALLCLVCHLGQGQGDNVQPEGWPQPGLSHQQWWQPQVCTGTGKRQAGKGRGAIQAASLHLSFPHFLLLQLLGG